MTKPPPHVPERSPLPWTLAALLLGVAVMAAGWHLLPSPPGRVLLLVGSFPAAAGLAETIRERCGWR